MDGGGGGRGRDWEKMVMVEKEDGSVNWTAGRARWHFCCILRIFKCDWKQYTGIEGWYWLSEGLWGKLLTLGSWCVRGRMAPANVTEKKAIAFDDGRLSACHTYHSHFRETGGQGISGFD